MRKLYIVFSLIFLLVSFSAYLQQIPDNINEAKQFCGSPDVASYYRFGLDKYESQEEFLAKLKAASNYCWGQYYESKGNNRRAIIYYEDAIKSDDKLIDAYLSVAYLYIQDNRITDAENSYESALNVLNRINYESLSEEDQYTYYELKMEILSSIAPLYEEENRYDRTIELYNALLDEFIQLKKEGLEEIGGIPIELYIDDFYLQIGDIYYRQGLIDLALKMYNLTDNYIFGRARVGKVHFCKGEYEKAYEEINSIIVEVNKTNAEMPFEADFIWNKLYVEAKLDFNNVALDDESYEFCSSNKE